MTDPPITPAELASLYLLRVGKPASTALPRAKYNDPSEHVNMKGSPMIPYINTRLIDWATWSKRSADGGMGYPRKSSYCDLVPIRSDGSAGPVVTDSAAMEIERIMAQIKGDRPDMWSVAEWFYLAGSMTVERIAKELGCHRDTVYSRLNALHLIVMDKLQNVD